MQKLRVGDGEDGPEYLEKALRRIWSRMGPGPEQWSHKREVGSDPEPWDPLGPVTSSSLSPLHFLPLSSVLENHPYPFPLHVCEPQTLQVGSGNQIGGLEGKVLKQISTRSPLSA